MAVQTTPFAIQSGGETAPLFRRLASALWGARGGIIGSGDLAVAQNGTPNMSVNVATGQVIVPGSQATYQGLYFGENQGTTNLAIAPADSTNPRRDLVVARVQDSAYSGSADEFSIEVVTGTPAASPSDPSLPSGSCWVLARVQVNAGASSITNANITDLRTTYTGQFGRAAALGGKIICTSSTRPTAPFAGMQIRETDTGREYNYSGSAWVIPHPLGRLGHAVLNANSSAFTSIIYPLSVTVTALANRRLRVHVHANVFSTTDGANISVSVCDAGGTIANQAYRTVQANKGDQITVEHLVDSGAGGSLTFQLGAYSTDSSLVTASGTAYTSIAVYDEGPA